MRGPVRGFFLCMVIGLVRELRCDSAKQCYGWRTRLASGYCPVPSGGKCDVDEKLSQCDTELGYTCIQGVCAGLYNLTVVHVGDTSVTLTWAPILHQGQRDYDYTVLYSTLLQDLPKLSNSHEVGTQNKFTLQWLLPATVYFVQVAVVGGQNSNLSEIVVFKTKARDYCLFNGRHIPVGKRFPVECEESCLCVGTGRLECVPVCSLSRTELPECRDNVSRSNMNCCVKVSNCSHDSCRYQGRSVPHGHTWVLDCAENCTCRDGIVTCQPLCNDLTLPENCTEKTLFKSEDGCCETYVCNKTGNPTTVVSPSMVMHDRVSISASVTVTNISSDSAIITWFIPEPLLYQISSFEIKYKRLSDLEWQYTPRLIFTERFFHLRCLHHLHWYDVHLYVYPGRRRIATTFFNTTNIKESTVKEYVLSIVNVTVLPDSVRLTWTSLTEEAQQNVSHIEILWSTGSYGDSVIKACLPASQKAYTITDLRPGLTYTVWVAVCVLDGTTVLTNKVHTASAHFPGATGGMSRSSLLIAIVIACVTFAVICVAITTVFYLFRYRRRVSYLTDTHFENRIYQIYNSQDRDA